MAKELELKLDLGGQQKGVVMHLIEGVFKKEGLSIEFSSKLLINQYYDTPEFDLNAHKMALRIRDLGGRYVQTLKTKGNSVDGFTERGEWEWDVCDISQRPELLTERDVWPEGIDVAKLAVVFETNFERQSAEFDFLGARIELAIDFGEVVSLGKTELINELELELKGGQVDGLKAFGKLLLDALGAKPGDISKAERGYRLYRS